MFVLNLWAKTSNLSHAASLYQLKKWPMLHLNHHCCICCSSENRSPGSCLWNSGILASGAVITVTNCQFRFVFFLNYRCNVWCKRDEIDAWSEAAWNRWGDETQRSQNGTSGQRWTGVTSHWPLILTLVTRVTFPSALEAWQVYCPAACALTARRDKTPSWQIQCDK